MKIKEAIDFLENDIKLFLITDDFFEQLGIPEKKKVADRNIRKVIELLQRGEINQKQSKHQALLNNCIDDDEAILHEREIEEGGTN